jgi:hypothetical protein
MSDERPWEDYANPLPTHPVEGAGAYDWGDIGRGAVGGLERGVTSLAGTGGTIGEMNRAALAKIGVPDTALNIGSKVVSALPAGALLTGPSGRDIQRKAEEYTGPFYEPHTVPGQYASTLAEFAPGAALPGGGGVTARTIGTVVPALASETAGQVTKGSPWEPWARAGAGLPAALLGGRLVTPAPPPTAARQAAVDVLDRYGIPLTAGQRTGSRAVQWAEATAGDMPLSSGRFQTLDNETRQQLERAYTHAMFDPAELARRGIAPDTTVLDPNVMTQGRRSLSDAYTDLSARNAIVDHPEIRQELTDAQRNYERMALPSQRASGTRDIATIRNDITAALNRGSIPGDAYQAWRSRMGTLAESTKNTDPILANSLRDVRGALDRGMQRGLSPEDAAAWQLTNQRWQAMKQLTPAIASAGETMSPARTAQAVRAGRQQQFAENAGPLDELSRAAATVVKPMPSSGTAQRTGWQQLFGLPGVMSAGGGVLGSTFGPVGAAAGFVAPHLAARTVLSRPGQAYLSNQVAPETGRDVITRALAQQAASQPSGIMRNEADQEAYRIKREQEQRARGL